MIVITRFVFVREAFGKVATFYTREFPSLFHLGLLNEFYGILVFCRNNFSHCNVLVPLAVVLSGLEAERCEHQIASIPLARGAIAEECAYIHVLVLATKFLQNYLAFAHLASLGLLACHLLGLALMDNSED